MDHNETEESKPKGTRVVYTINRWVSEIEPDGTVLIGAYTVDGAVIWLANFRDELYEVVVDGPDEPRGGRSYRGGPGSLAHNRFEKFRAAYESLFGPLTRLDEAAFPGDTDPRQDDPTASQRRRGSSPEAPGGAAKGSSDHRT